MIIQCPIGIEILIALIIVLIKYNKRYANQKKVVQTALSSEMFDPKRILIKGSFSFNRYLKILAEGGMDGSG